MVQKTAYPQPDFAREHWLNLNGTWDFSFDRPTLDQKIEVPYPWGSPLSGIDASRNATAFYRRTVRFDGGDERVFLIFGAVDYSCAVTVNGKILGTHTGGYSRFEWDVTEYWDNDGENEILIEATDMAEKHQTYGKQGYGDARGIWQTVWLETRPAAHIKSFFVKTKLDGTVTYEIETEGASDTAVITAHFPDALLTGIPQTTVQNGKATLTFRVEEHALALWSPEDPFLYEGSITLTAEESEDTVYTYFGIREIGTGRFGVHNQNYITLNGKPYYLCGVLDQSFNPKGYFTLPSDDDCREEILRLKRLGLNMARIHIKAEEPLKLYWADRLGLLIMEDIPCFWGDPLPETRAQYETEMRDQILRDRNHPSLFYWVIFNETWGLFSHIPNEKGEVERIYTDETAKWVEACFRTAKELDPTRLIEDNSPCNSDHTVTDVNTWHFYANGYETVKAVVENFVNHAYPGTTQNYKAGYTMADVPCMNSECGNVWGIKNNAGDSDISWQYKYMMNEFRLHDKLCGFVFTEFHDVVNEFNGYYKIDNDDKDFGYTDYGMTIRDLHAKDYLGADFAPMTTVKPYELVTVPLFGSSFTDLRHGKLLQVVWQLLLMDPIEGDIVADSGTYSLLWADYGTFPAGEVNIEIPEHDGVAMLSFALMDGGEPVMQNAILFDVDSPRTDVLSIAPIRFGADGFDHSFTAQAGNKLNGLGSGVFTTTIRTEDIPGLEDAEEMHIYAELSTREPMTHDWPGGKVEGKVDLNYMLGYRCDPGANLNSFPQTDSRRNPGIVEICIDGIPVERISLADCPADSRGALSHHYQKADDELDEAGSYGYLCDCRIPTALLYKLQKKEAFTLTFRTESGAGLSLFGRKSGRYGMDVVIRATTL